MTKYIQRNYDPNPAEGGTPTVTPAPDPATPPVAPTPPAPVEPADPPEPELTPEQIAAQETSDSLLKTILGDLNPNPTPPPEEPVTPAPEAPVVPPVAPAPVTPPVEPAKPRAKKTLVPAVEPPPIPEPVAAPAPPAPVAAPVDPDVAYVSTLREEQQEELREMEVAERISPERYKGKRKALIEFYRTYDTRAPAIAAANPDEDFSENADYKALMAAKPVLTPLDYKRVQRTIGQEEATVAVERKLAPEIAENKMRLRELEVRPEVQEEVAGMHNAINDLFVADTKSPIHEMAKLFAEKGPEALVNNPDLKLEINAASQEMPRARSLMAEYMLFQKGARTFNAENPLHMELFNFIEDQADALQQAGGLTRGGKRFLSRTQFAEQVKANGHQVAAKKYFTFSDEDVKNLIVKDTKLRIEKNVAQKLAENEAMGFVRKGKAAAAAPTRTEPTPITPPVAAPTINRTSTTPAPATGNENDINPIEILGLKTFRSTP